MVKPITEDELFIIHDYITLLVGSRENEHTIFCLSNELKVQTKMRLCELLDVDETKCEDVPWQKG